MWRPRDSVDRIHRAFHDHRDRANGEPVLKNAEQLRSFVVQRCCAGVEVFGSCSVEIADFGMPSTDESEHLTVVDDREDDPVAEAVDQPVLAMVATPVMIISSSLTPYCRRWSTRLVQPVGA